MRSLFSPFRTVLFPVLGVAALAVSSLAARADGLAVGDPAPPIVVKSFVKGTPITNLADGKATVVEFWATWCPPCRESIPHLTALAQQYPNIRFLGISVWESDQAKVAPFVASMGDKMKYTVALDTLPAGATVNGMEGVMAKTWMAAAQQNGIPTAFVVGGDGRIEWIGYPWQIDEPIAKIAAGNWDIAAARADFDYTMAYRHRQELMQEALASIKTKGDPAQSVAALDALVAQTPDVEHESGPTKFEFLRQMGDEARALAYGTRFVDGIGKDGYWALNKIAWQIVNPAAKIKPNAAMLALALRAADRADTLEKHARANVADTLAAAQFASGDFAAASATEDRASSLAKAENSASAPAYAARAVEYQRSVTTNK